MDAYDGALAARRRVATCCGLTGLPEPVVIGHDITREGGTIAQATYRHFGASCNAVALA
jgi:hypothetical protein